MLIITMTKQAHNAVVGTAPVDSAGAGAPDQVGEVTVSPEMRDAGEIAFDEFFGSYPTSLLVEAVYRAMRVLEPDQAASEIAFELSAQTSLISDRRAKAG